MTTQLKKSTQTDIKSLAQEVGNYTDSHVDNMSIKDLRAPVKQTGNVLGSLLGGSKLFSHTHIIISLATTTGKLKLFLNWLMEDNSLSIMFLFLSGEIIFYVSNYVFIGY